MRGGDPEGERSATVSAVMDHAGDSSVSEAAGKVSTTTLGASNGLVCDSLRGNDYLPAQSVLQILPGKLGAGGLWNLTFFPLLPFLLFPKLERMA